MDCSFWDLSQDWQHIISSWFKGDAMKFNLKKMLIVGAIIYASVYAIIMLITGFVGGISNTILLHAMGITATGLAARQIVTRLYRKAYN